MTIDERLEALAQTVELIAHIQQAEEKRAAERDAITGPRIGRVLGIVEKLADTAQNHERRIERL
jgi:hypothetical protein